MVSEYFHHVARFGLGLGPSCLFRLVLNLGFVLSGVVNIRKRARQTHIVILETSHWY